MPGFYRMRRYLVRAAHECTTHATRPNGWGTRRESNPISYLVGGVVALAAAGRMGTAELAGAAGAGGVAMGNTGRVTWFVVDGSSRRRT